MDDLEHRGHSAASGDVRDYVLSYSFHGVKYTIIRPCVFPAAFSVTRHVPVRIWKRTGRCAAGAAEICLRLVVSVWYNTGHTGRGEKSAKPVSRFSASEN